MKFSYDKDQDVLCAFLKFNSWKVNDVKNHKRFMEQVFLAINRVESQHIYPKTIDGGVDVYYGYNGDDFLKGKKTLRLKFKIQKNEE